jgi:hypothetical protein
MTVIADKRRYMRETKLLAMAQTVEITRLLRDRTIPEIAQQLRSTVPALANTFGTVGSIISADSYNRSRAQANLSAPYTATPKTAQNADRLVQGAIGFGIASLTKGSTYSTFQTNLAGSVAKIVQEYDRATVEQNSFEDNQAVLYERVPSGNACAFCLTMAAVAEVQRSDQFDGYHNFCNCTLNPVFRGQSKTTSPIYKQAQDAYSLASSEIEKRREEVGWYSMKTRQAAKAFPELTQTTENRLRLVREITGWK